MAAVLDIPFNARRHSDQDWTDEPVDDSDVLKKPQSSCLTHDSIVLTSIPLVAAFLYVLLTILFSAPALAQSSEVANGTVDWPREHIRVERIDSPGKRTEILQLKGTTLFVGPKVELGEPVPLVVHFHGAPWIIEQHISNHLPGAALVTVQLGAGSSVYGKPFVEEKMFSQLLSEAERSAGAKRGWSTITLTAFSAGYAAVRAILRHKAHFERVNGVLLLDGIHAGYEPERTSLAAAGNLLLTDLDAYTELAREAAAGRKYFVITHSQIHPGSYASTTECTNQLLRDLGLRREMYVRRGPLGMQQLTKTEKARFRVFGYAGETAADHVDHIHAMPHWFGLLGVR